MELDNTTVLAIRGAAHAVKWAAENLSLWGADAFRAIASAARAWECLAKAKLAEVERPQEAPRV